MGRISLQSTLLGRTHTALFSATHWPQVWTRLWGRVQNAGLHLAIATVDLLHSLCHQNRLFLPALQLLQLGVSLQPNVVTTEWNGDTEDTWKAHSGDKTLYLPTLRVSTLVLGSLPLPFITSFVSVVHGCGPGPTISAPLVDLVSQRP